MTKNELNILIENPAKVLNENMAGLKKLAIQFPYSQAIQILYTKALHKNKSIDYLQQLKYTAAITSNRKVLYEIIMRQELLEKINNIIIEDRAEEQVETSVVTTTKNTTIIVEPKNQIIETTEEKNLFIEPIDYSDYTINNNNKNTVTKSDDYIFTAIQTEKIEYPKNEDNTFKEIETTEEIIEKPIEDKASISFSELEKQILWEAVNASVQVDVIKDLEQRPVIIPQEKNEEKPIQNQDFLSWLSGKTKQETTTLTVKTNTNRSEIESLVDRFIQNEPKITPQKTAFFTPGNVAKLSITDNEDFVSETLAKIYEKQGYYPKAIKVYQKLSLKIPEKSVYFAARIQELKELKNKK